jgi:hypothetical protein
MAPDTRPPAPTTRAGDARRRGTVLLFALGVLAVIAVAGLSYISFVRVERRAADAESSQPDGDRQARIARDHIGALIAADLWGGKVVPPTLPQYFNDDDPLAGEIWPRMFEDGEFRDYPDANFRTFSTFDDDGDPEDNDSVLFLDQNTLRFELAEPDDAWLASTEPIWDRFGGFHHWRQITNLRSGYTYDPGEDGDVGTRDDRWIRGDGLYVDLAQFFFDYIGRDGGERANPSTDLLDVDLPGEQGWTTTDARGFAPGAVVPHRAAGAFQTSPFVHLNFMDNAVPQSADFAERGGPVDTRFWADTDGDLHPDARWQQLEAFGAHEGLIWVIAARVVDASSMVNYNASIGSAYESIDPGDFATGHTPGDVDLYRLLKESRGGSFELFGARASQFAFADRITTQNIVLDAPAFEQHLNASLDLSLSLRDIGISETGNANEYVTGGSIVNFHETGAGGERLFSTLRTRMWNWFGASPQNPRINALAYDTDGLINGSLDFPGPRPELGYPVSDLLDLQAYWGTNQRNLLSKAERVFDGKGDQPEGVGLSLLPRRDTQTQILFGPTLAAEAPRDSRFYGDVIAGFGQGEPTADQVRYSTRRLLTPVSGASDLGPIPLLNTDARSFDRNGNIVPSYEGRTAIPRVRLATFSRDDVPSAYNAFVWALAPLATDQTLTPALQPDPDAGLGAVNGRVLGQEASYHYGATTNGAAGPANPNVLGGSNVGPAYAMRTAAALALNLADATDADDTPSIARLVTPSTHLQSQDTRAVRARTFENVFLFGDRFPHGDVPPPLLTNASQVLGNRVTGSDELNRRADTAAIAPNSAEDWLRVEAGNSGLTMVGLEAHPYITEAYSAALYASIDDFADPRFDRDDGASQVAAALAFQLANPWTTEIDLTGYEIWLLKPGVTDLTSSEHLRFRPAVGAEANDDAVNWTMLPAARDSGAPAAKTFVFWAANGGAVVPGEQIIGNAGEEIAGDSPALSIVQQISALDSGATAPNPVPFRLIPVDPGQIDEAAQPVFFSDFLGTGGTPRILLVKTGVIDFDGTGGEDPKPLIVDQLVAQPGANFPALPASAQFYARDDLGIDEDYLARRGYIPQATSFRNRYDANQVGGRYLVTGSLTRPTAPSENDGMSMMALDFDGEFSHLVEVHTAHGWLVPANPFLGDPVDASGWPQIELINGVETEFADGVAGGNGTGGNAIRVVEAPAGPRQSYLDDTGVKPAADGLVAGGAPLPFQLFVPNRPLRYLSELHMLSTYAHVCLNNNLDILDNWTTVGRQLAESLSYDFGTPGGRNNPYVGVLDPSRFFAAGGLFNDNPLGIIRDQSMAVPLATRVFDAFEALEAPRGSLANGRININTAPERVLQTLPLVAPPPNTVAAQAANPTFGLGPKLNDRTKLILQYRDAWDPDDGENLQHQIGATSPGYAPSSITRLGIDTNNEGQLRRTEFLPRSFNPFTYNPDNANAAYPFRRGFATTGELAILSSWADDPASAELDGFYPTFGGAGADGFASLGNNGSSNDDPYLDTYPGSGDDRAETATAYEPADDHEERLALFKAISNIATTRSDVFIAWFTIRGYDPASIEAIPIEDTDDPTQAMELGDPSFSPAYESRWIAVYDRSNVRRPTDRPRVLLFSRLPEAAP